MNRPIKPSRNTKRISSNHGVEFSVVECTPREERIGSEVWLLLTFGRGLPAARHEQEVDGALYESRACSVGLLEPLEFIGKLGVDG